MQRLTRCSVRIWGEPEDFFKHAEHSLEQAQISNVPLHDIIDVIGGYVGKGYAGLGLLDNH